MSTIWFDGNKIDDNHFNLCSTSVHITMVATWNNISGWYSWPEIITVSTINQAENSLFIQIHHYDNKIGQNTKPLSLRTPNGKKILNHYPFFNIHWPERISCLCRAIIYTERCWNSVTNLLKSVIAIHQE